MEDPGGLVAARNPEILVEIPPHYPENIGFSFVCEILNERDEKVEIKAVRTSCGCLKVVEFPSNISGKEIALINLEVSSFRDFNFKTEELIIEFDNNLTLGIPIRISSPMELNVSNSFLEPVVRKKGEIEPVFFSIGGSNIGKLSALEPLAFSVTGLELDVALGPIFDRGGVFTRMVRVDSWLNLALWKGELATIEFVDMNGNLHPSNVSVRPRVL